MCQYISLWTGGEWLQHTNICCQVSVIHYNAASFHSKSKIQTATILIPLATGKSWFRSRMFRNIKLKQTHPVSLDTPKSEHEYLKGNNFIQVTPVYLLLLPTTFCLKYNNRVPPFNLPREILAYKYTHIYSHVYICIHMLPLSIRVWYKLINHKMRSQSKRRKTIVLCYVTRRFSAILLNFMKSCH